QLQRELDAVGKEATWDLANIGRFDYVGAQILWRHRGAQWPQKYDISDAQREILERVAELSQVEKPEPARWHPLDQIDKFGVLVLAGCSHLKDLVELIGQLLLDFLRLLRQPQRGPWRDFSGHLYSMGATALPITA